MLSLVGPAGVVESSLEAPSSSADARVCIQNWFCFGDLKFWFGICLVARRLAGGKLFRYIAELMWGSDGQGSEAGSVCMFGLSSFCRVKLIV
jgi:hypothetical protein